MCGLSTSRLMALTVESGMIVIMTVIRINKKRFIILPLDNYLSIRLKRVYDIAQKTENSHRRELSRWL